MLWLKERGIACVSCPTLFSCVLRFSHVNNALKVDWDTSRSATHGVNNGAALFEDHVAQLKEIFPDEGEDLA
ncbi:hypothetical protein Hanom_Chr16g01437341 [Helianthus anomalus]